jgi:opacity protein-like surface antigen
VWRDLSPRVRAGVEIGGSVGRGEGDATESRSHNLVIRPSVMMFSGQGALRPYTTVGVFMQQYSMETDQDLPFGSFRNEQTDLGAQAGVGLEWRPASRVAVGGHVGISGYHSSQESGNPEGDLSESDGWTVGTFNSGIAIHLFF